MAANTYKYLFKNCLLPIMLKLYEYKKMDEEVYSSRLSKDLDITYSHLVKLINALEDDKFVQCNKQGRLKLLSLTDTGVQVAEQIHVLQAALKAHM